MPIVIFLLVRRERSFWWNFLSFLYCTTSAGLGLSLRAIACCGLQRSNKISRSLSWCLEECNLTFMHPVLVPGSCKANRGDRYVMTSAEELVFLVMDSLSHRRWSLKVGGRRDAKKQYEKRRKKVSKVDYAH
jgi:hypothetical protein